MIHISTFQALTSTHLAATPYVNTCSDTPLNAILIHAPNLDSPPTNPSAPTRENPGIPKGERWASAH